MTQPQYNQAAYLRSIECAATVCGRTSPNPAVGAVVVRDDNIIAWGATQMPGGNHAERQALLQAGTAALGADLYVTLEPCTFHGRTPPCTDAIVAAGIARVFYVMRDPDPRMHGGAADVLNAHGIECIQIPSDDDRIRLQLAPFFLRIQQQRPWLTWKYAMSLDGKIATHAGMSQWISTSESRSAVHAIRNRVDAIMTGSGTVLSDDPLLTIRLADTVTTQQPLRVVIDSRGQSPLSARVFIQKHAATIVFCTLDTPPAWQHELVRRGVQVVCQPNTGHVDLALAMTQLSELGVNHVLLEAGAGLAGACADAQLIDEIHCFIAPGLIGNQGAPGPLAGVGIDQLNNWRAYRFVGQSVHAGDIHLHALHHRIDTLFQPTDQGVTACLPVS